MQQAFLPVYAAVVWEPISEDVSTMEAAEPRAGRWSGSRRGRPDGCRCRCGRKLVDRLQTSDDGRTIVGVLRVPGTFDVVDAIRWRC
jgi:hypothetical protein